MNQTTQTLLEFIRRCPTAYQTVEEIEKILLPLGFENLSVSSASIKPGGKYYLTNNRSSIIAFIIPESFTPVFSIMASHTDSPTFKIKEKGEREAGNYIILETERYGGPILSTWLDRPLSLAGRAIVRKEQSDGSAVFVSESIVFDRDLLVIPNAPIHLQRSLNEGYQYQLNVDFMPLLSDKRKVPTLQAMSAEVLGVTPEDILSLDLYLTNRTQACIFGANGEFFASPRIDNLQCVYGTLQGFLQSTPQENISVFAAFDSEEIGSATKMGAESMFLLDTLNQIANNLNFDCQSAIRSSVMISADNAHAVHPNHPELSDTKRAPILNGGIVLKHQASQKYTTDALSSAVVTEVARRANVPLQYYANRSDLPGGSTLGSIATTKVGMTAADIGMAQLAMHSSYETAGSEDTDYLIQFSRCFYESKCRLKEDGIIKFY